MNSNNESNTETTAIETTATRVNELLEKMTLQEKIGQMSQFANRKTITDDFREAIRQGNVGSILWWR